MRIGGGDDINPSQVRRFYAHILLSMKYSAFPWRFPVIIARFARLGLWAQTNTMNCLFREQKMLQ